MSKYLIAIKDITRKLTVTAKRICGQDYEVDLNTKLREQELQPFSGDKLFDKLYSVVPEDQINSEKQKPKSRAEKIDNPQQEDRPKN